MKFLKLTRAAVAALTIMSLTACDDKDEPTTPAITVNLSDASLNYDAQGVWNECYNTTYGDLAVSGVVFSHQAYESWGYLFWDGFCASKSSDTADYTADNTWVDHQYSSITGGGVAGTGTPYIVGYWSTFSIVDNSNTISLVNGASFKPDAIYVTNTTWGYYAMLNGTAMSKKFDSSDWCKVHIQGQFGGSVTGTVDVDLAKGTDILKTWKKVDLSSLGEVDRLVFTMTSSDSGEYGMNNPSYFCIDQFSYYIYSAAN